MSEKNDKSKSTASGCETGSAWNPARVKSQLVSTASDSSISEEAGKDGKDGPDDSPVVERRNEQ